MDQFMLELKQLVTSCDYKDETEMVRDAFVIGVRDDVVKEKLLRKSDLTLDETIKIYKVHEASKQQIKEMIGSTEALQLEVNKLNRKGYNPGLPTGSQSNQYQCFEFNRNKIIIIVS